MTMKYRFAAGRLAVCGGILTNSATRGGDQKDVHHISLGALEHMHSAKGFASYRRSNQEVCTLGCH
jgi:hypothetical protein